MTYEWKDEWIQQSGGSRIWLRLIDGWEPVRHHAEVYGSDRIRSDAKEEG